MRPKIKICGITTLADARYCAGAGTDYLGFIQYPPSPRYIAPQEVAAIAEWIYGPKSVGVFVNEDAHRVNQIADIAKFDFVQLHGNESPAYCERMNRPVIKAFRIRPDMTIAQLNMTLEAYVDVIAWYLLDTWHPVLPGGTGTTFNWQHANALTVDVPLMLSGGLSPENVMNAVQDVQPWGIDLSSSLEHSPGHKDYTRVSALFEKLEDMES